MKLKLDTVASVAILSDANELLLLLTYPGELRLGGRNLNDKILESVASRACAALSNLPQPHPSTQ